MLGDPLRNQKAIRATLNDRTAETWAVPTLAEALRSAEDARFAVLKVVTRPCLSKKRVAAVCGSASGEPWARFFRKGATSSPSPPAAERSARATKRAKPTVVKKAASGNAIPLRNAGALVRDGISGRASGSVDPNTGGRKRKSSTAADPYLEGNVQCRECLRVYKRIQLPNPRRRVCEDCGGQPESSSVRTVSGGSPGLGRRR